MAKKKKKKAPLAPLCVEIMEAKPNKLFTEKQRAWIRFLRYSRWIRCVVCGKKRKVMWTMLHEFMAITMDTAIGVIGEKDRKGPYPPLTPVCGDHPIGPPTEEELADE